MTKFHNESYYIELPDTGLEVKATVSQQFCPAEPDVGIFHRSVELDVTSVEMEGVEIMPMLQEWVVERITEDCMRQAEEMV